jgi:hypothetical protein
VNALLTRVIGTIAVAGGVMLYGAITTIVPAIGAPCTPHTYVYVPAVLKVRATCELKVTAILEGAPLVFAKITLCPPELKANVIVPPRDKFTVPGLNRREAVVVTVASSTGIIGPSRPESSHPSISGRMSANKRGRIWFSWGLVGLPELKYLSERAGVPVELPCPFMARV